MASSHHTAVVKALSGKLPLLHGLGGVIDNTWYMPNHNEPILCEFCKNLIELNDEFVVVARNFEENMDGAWAACEECHNNLARHLRETGKEFSFTITEMEEYIEGLSSLDIKQPCCEE